MWHSLSKADQSAEQSANGLKRDFFHHILIFSHFLKYFLEETLVSVTVRVPLFLKIFSKKQPISLDWFAVQQVFSTSRTPKNYLFQEKLKSTV